MQIGRSPPRPPAPPPAPAAEAAGPWHILGGGGGAPQWSNSGQILVKTVVKPWSNRYFAARARPLGGAPRPPPHLRPAAADCLVVLADHATIGCAVHTTPSAPRGRGAECAPCDMALRLLVAIRRNAWCKGSRFPLRCSVLALRANGRKRWRRGDAPRGRGIAIAHTAAAGRRCHRVNSATDCCVIACRSVAREAGASAARRCPCCEAISAMATGFCVCRDYKSHGLVTRLAAAAAPPSRRRNPARPPPPRSRCRPRRRLATAI